MGAPTAICCPCGNEKILALGLCATCYTLKRQDAEYFDGLREQVLERDGHASRVCGDPDPGGASSGTGQVRAASDDRSLSLSLSLCVMSREGPPDEGCPYGVSAASTGTVAGAATRRPRTDVP
jgi:hypothetical protein